MMAKKVKLPENGHVNPYDAREAKNDAKAMRSTKKGVKPVANDTNKTRRKMEKPTAIGPQKTKSPGPAANKESTHAIQKKKGI